MTSRAIICWAITVILSPLFLGCGGEPPTEFGGFAVDRFELGGRRCVVIRPCRLIAADGTPVESPRETAAAGRPWVWRARFLHGAPQVDTAFLEHGYHVAWIDVANTFGNPACMSALDGFHRQVVDQYDLSDQVALQGFSRGGYIAMNWAARNPAKTAAIYLDAPVLDFTSWPQGSGMGTGSVDALANCVAAWGTDIDSLDDSNRPLSETCLQRLMERDVPILTVCGESDEIVPFPENSGILIQRYRDFGGRIDLILKAGVGHHPHSLEDPAPILTFVSNAFAAKSPRLGDVHGKRNDHD